MRSVRAGEKGQNMGRVYKIRVGNFPASVIQ